jgi:hypothetical protein
MNLKIGIMIVFSLLILVFPFIVVQSVTTDSTQQYTFKSKIVEKLYESQDGWDKYFLAESIEGNSPASEFVIYFPKYTIGLDSVSLEKNSEVWVQGKIMTREVYFGEHYQFFDRQQVYADQVKDKGLWPFQITGLKRLYLSPITSFFNLILFPFFLIGLFADITFNSSERLAGSASAILIALTAFLLIKARHQKQNLILLILYYWFLSMLLILPFLKDSLR